MIVRASSLNRSIRCPGYHRLAQRIGPVSSEASVRGTAIHADIEARVRNTTKHEQKADWDEDGFFAWLSDTFLWWPGDHYAEVELKRHVGSNTLVGHADLSNDGLVVDWKTGEGRHLPPIDQDWQMLAYASLCPAGGRPVSVYRVLVDKREYEALFFNEDEMETVREAVDEVVLQVAEGGELTPSLSCRDCMLRTRCDAYLAGALPIRLMTENAATHIDPELAVELANSLGAVRGALKRADAELRRHVEQHGPIRSKGREWGPRLEHRDEFTDPMAMLSFLAVWINRISGRGSIYDPQGTKEASLACRTTKEACEDALRAAGGGKQEIESFWKEAMSRGLIEPKPITKFRWGRAPSIDDI